MTHDMLAPNTLQRLQQHAYQSGVSADALINRLLDNTPVPSPIPYATIVNEMVDIISLITPDGRYALVNKAMQTVTGIPVGQIIGKSNRELGFPEPLIESADKTHALVMSTRQEQSDQFTFPSPDGMHFYEVRLSPVFDGHGDIMYLLSVTHDITERKKSQTNLQAVLDSSLTGIMAYQPMRDEAGKIVDLTLTLMNRWAEKITGYETHEIIGKRFLELFPINRDNGVYDMYLRVIETGEPIKRVFYYNSPGLRAWYEIAVSPLEGGIMVAFNDITAEKIAQDALTESETRFRTMANAAPVLIWASGLDKLCNFFNEVWLNFTGKTFEQEYGNGWAEGVHPDDFDRCLQIYTSSFDAREQFHMDYRLRRYDGEYRWILDHGVPRFGADGEFLGYIGSCIDITEKKQAEEAIRQSEVNYRLLFQEAPIAIWKRDFSQIKTYLEGLRASGISDIEGYLRANPHETEKCLALAKTLEINNVGLKTYKVQSVQEMNTNLTKMMTLGDPQPASLTAIVDGKTSFSGEFVNRALDGSRINMLVKWIVLPGHEATYDEVLVVSVDITELKQAEEAIRQSEANYRLLFQEAPIAIWKRDFSQIKTYLEGLRASGITNMQGYLRENPKEVEKCLRMVETIEANNIGLEMYKGKSVQEINDNFSKIVALGEPQPASLTAVLDGNTSFSGEFVNQTLDGKKINMLLKWIVLPGHEATYDEVLVVTVDITHLKQAEEAIRESEANYRLLFQEAPIAIWKQDFSHLKAYLDEITATGIDDIESYLRTHPQDVGACLKLVGILEANTTALSMYEATSIDSVNNLFHQVIINDDPQQPASLAAVANGKTTFSGEFINKTVNGNTIYLLIKWLVMHGHEQNYDEVLVATLDITEQKRYELASMENERLTSRFRKEQEHNSLIQRSVSALSHDLRTPLAVIGISKDLLLKHFDKLTEERRKEKLEGIGRQLEFAMELLDDTVAMVRGALSERAFHPTRVNLAKLCQVSVDEVGMSYHASNRLRFANVGRVNDVEVDEILVSRILLNLLSNAIKYSPNKADIRLELDQKDTHLLIRVMDKGVGIHPDNIPHIFEPFYRVPETQNIQGTGLGLSIVQECVERHHGRIWVDSELGKGTTFTVELPLMIKEARVG